MGSQANLLQALGWAILNSLWQLALLWVIYQVITGVFRQVRPATRSALAASLLISGFGWFLYTFIITLVGSTGNSLLPVGNNINLLGYINNLIRISLPYASILYLGLLAIPLLRFTRNFRYVQVIRKYGKSKMDPEWRLFVQHIAARMGITKPVHVYISEWVSSPVTIGFLKPVILVPIAAVNNLSTSQMEAVLLHELAHIRRFDYLVNFIINVIRVILYFNPFANAFVRIVETEREKSCDELVLQFQYKAHDYASALLSLEKISLNNNILIVPASGNRQDLFCRVEAMLGLQKHKAFGMRRLGALLAGILCVLCVNALLLVSKPAIKQWAWHKKVAASTEGFEGRDMAALIERPENMVINAIKQSSASEKPVNTQHTPPPAPRTPEPLAELHPDIINANFEVAPPVVVLDKDQEAQVKEAMEASRKVLENIQWKQVEKKLADVFNENEKEKLRNEWTKVMNSKMNWQLWENKLRSAYDKVDWDRVNVQLDNAINQIQVDSLVTVYNHTISDLREVQRALNRDSLNAIPDTDITLKEIAEKQKQVQKALLDLKKVRGKRIVQL